MKPKATEREDQDWIEVSNRWLEISAQIDALKKQQHELKAQLIELSTSQSSVGGGVRLVRCIRKGVVQYAEIPELKEVDLEKYRKASTEVWMLSKKITANQQDQPKVHDFD